jgi:sugar phosphate isomerase/epimerase
VLGQVAEHCRQVGIGCAIENKLPHLLFASIRDLLWILASMGQVPIGVCLDTGHGQLAGDLRSIIQKLTGYLLMVHAHDNHGRGDDHQPPGTGSGFQFGSRPARIRSARGVYRLLVITQNRLND